MPALAQVLGATSRLCPGCARTQPISAHLTSRRPVAGPVLTGLGWFQTGCVSAVLRLRTCRSGVRLTPGALRDRGVRQRSAPAPYSSLRIVYETGAVVAAHGQRLIVPPLVPSPAVRRPGHPAVALASVSSCSPLCKKREGW